MLIHQIHKIFSLFKELNVTLLLTIGCITSIMCQQGVTTIGFQVKPIVPINYFGAGPIELTSDSAIINISSKMGYSFGMVIRRGLTKTISIETGINYTRRNFKLTGTSSFENSSDVGDFGFVSYEIPIQSLVYIRLAEKLYMNASIGLGINFSASDVASKGENFYIDHYSERAYWINLSFLSNLGLEYRTKEDGYFYLGASLNTPFWPIALTTLKYYYQNNDNVRFDPIYLNGNYLTIDFRYFLPQKEKEKID